MENIGKENFFGKLAKKIHNSDQQVLNIQMLLGEIKGNIHFRLYYITSMAQVIKQQSVSNIHEDIRSNNRMISLYINSSFNTSGVLYNSHTVSVRFKFNS